MHGRRSCHPTRERGAWRMTRGLWEEPPPTAALGRDEDVPSGAPRSSVGLQEPGPKQTFSNVPDLVRDP